MDMTEWAKREVEIACKREHPNCDEMEWDYVCSCYKSALKAYMSLMEDEHSGMSFSITKDILKRLMDGKPLTPIVDNEEDWNKVSYSKEEYQSKRMSSLFKTIGNDGKVRFRDINRAICRNVENLNVAYSFGHANQLMDEMFPITMPYYPETGRYELTCEELLTDRKNGDSDTWACLTLKKPDGEKVSLLRYFKECENGFVEITFDEYKKRRLMHMQREETERNVKKRTE